jgi:hypothetical protein
MFDPTLPHVHPHGGYGGPALTFAFATAAGLQATITTELQSAAAVMLAFGAVCGGIASLGTLTRNLVIDYRAWRKVWLAARAERAERAGKIDAALLKAYPDVACQDPHAPAPFPVLDLAHTPAP